MNPAAIHRECKCGGQQPIKGSTDTAFSDIAALCRVIEIAKVWQDRFVSHCRIIKRQRSREKAVPRDSVRVNVGR
jgi:hypothetical protein